MKTITKILFALFIALVLPISVYAQDTLSIGESSYNENTQIFTVSGVSAYSDVMVSLFDGEQLLSFKTVQPDGDIYTAVFKISFDQDKTITIKVGDINSTEYRMTTLDVKETAAPPTKLTDSEGNSLTIIKTDNTFELDDYLVIVMVDDFNVLSAGEREQLAAIQEMLGSKKQLFGLMFIMVRDGHNDDVNLEDITGGYKLFINMPEEALGGCNKPYMARLLDPDNLTLESGKEITFSTDEDGYVATLNNIGVYLLYDDISDLSTEYKFIGNTGNQTFDIAKDSKLVLKVDADHNKFVDLYVDNKKVDTKYYTIEEGSTVITLSKDYLKTLSKGKHTIKVEFTDGEAVTNLTVTDTSTATNPTTNDNMYKWVTLFVISLVGMTAGAIKFKKFSR